MDEGQMRPNVIDISHHNSIRDFGVLKASGILGVIHKCTQGAGYADPTYALRRKLVRDAGLLWGAYSFNTGEDITAQVDFFLKHADPDPDTLLALDFEDNPRSQMSLEMARTWLRLVEGSTGRKPVIYSGNRIKDLLGPRVDITFSGYRLWLAQYGPVAKVQQSWTKAWLWQYSESGRLPGTDGLIDLNFFGGSAEELAQQWAGGTTDVLVS